MGKLKSIAVLALLIILQACTSSDEEQYNAEQFTDENGYTYETVTNDPWGARIYTLKNGLKVFLTENKDEPRILGLIAVRTGSKNDPPETTGLSHYLEHMMFKGSDEIGTLDWEKEKPLLDEISDLYEQHMNTNDSIEKRMIYAKIDSVSQLASKCAVTNEYGKLCTIIGATNTNAGTGNESTVYINNIPSNELERWLTLESERFSRLVLRFFHTEIETVYEEFNMSQDNDYRKANEALMASLFQKHTYGTQTTLGKAGHLKNPSMVNIYNYWETYYVPNNMAILLSGDIDFDESIKLIDKYWGGFKPNENLPEFTFEPEDPITKPIIKEVFGPRAESVRLAFRLKGAGSEDEKITTIIDRILSNSRAGLIDLDLVQKQKVLRAYSRASFMADYGMFSLGGNPREGQTLEEVKDLLLDELEKIKKGDFEDWLIEAVINDMKLSQIRRMESNWRVYSMVNTFITNQEWIDYVTRLDDLAKITKEQIIEFANNNFKDNYVCVYKRTGENKGTVYVDKPKITKIDINRIDESDYIKNFNNLKSGKILPVFVDFEKSIQKEELKKDISYSYIKNETNELFSLYYIIDMGRFHNKKLARAVQYLPYLGTNKYSAEDLQKEFFKLGLRMGVNTGQERSYVYLSGLDKSMEKGIELLEHVLANAKEDQEAYDEFVKGIQKKRADAKLNKGTILWSGMYNFAQYGPQSPFTDILSEEELKAIDPKELVDILKDLYSYKHGIFYYGPREMGSVKGLLATHHKTPETLKEYPVPAQYPELDIDENKVYFVNYDMVQADILLLSKDKLFDKKLLPAINMYNEFYGRGLSSIIFQEIRESQGLAYSSYSSFSVPSKPEYSHYLSSFVGTQPDKIEEALNSILGLLNEMPEAQKQFNGSKENILKNIETERIIRDNIFWTYIRNKDRGIDYDYRKDIYKEVQNMGIEDIREFFDNHIKGKDYAILILGNRNNINMDLLKKYGEVRELTLEEIFNY